MTSFVQVPVGEVSKEGERATLTFRVRLDHPPEAVWAALTDPEQLEIWYKTRAKIDGRPGGSIDFTTGPGQLHATGRILHWQPPRLWEYEWKVKPWTGQPSGEDAVVRWELQPDGTQTLLTLTHRNLSRRAAAGAAPYVRIVLERLAAVLDGRRPPEFEERLGRATARSGK
ncbi:MAG: SRPBCC domain-containing protein [Thermoplasmata archaeon]|nr:SRPBCC domain-containing protein [Thermoplasmata archaeon]MCI4344597.1 SRPBCC domain-containing protein [Thermoplasmata archaeon]